MASPVVVQRATKYGTKAINAEKNNTTPTNVSILNTKLWDVGSVDGGLDWTDLNIVQTFKIT